MRNTALFFLCLSITYGAFAVDMKGVSFSEITAQDANYNGRTIVLSKDVAIDHHFGKLRCDKATLFLKAQAPGETKSTMPEKIVLEGRVHLEMKNGSSLDADTATINCLDLEGVFTAEEPRKVVYVTLMGEGENKTPVKTASKAMRVKMKKETNSSEYVVSEMKGEGAVSIEYLPQEKAKG